MCFLLVLLTLMKILHIIKLTYEQLLIYHNKWGTKNEGNSTRIKWP